MAFKRQTCISFGHPFTIVYHLNRTLSGIRYQYIYMLRSGINGILHQFFYNRRGTLYHLSCRYLISNRVRQQTYDIAHNTTTNDSLKT